LMVKLLSLLRQKFRRKKRRRSRSPAALARKRRQAQLRWLAHVTAFLRRIERQKRKENREATADGNLSPRGSSPGEAGHAAEEPPPSESATETMPLSNRASPDDASQADDSSCEVFDLTPGWKNHSLELEPLSFSFGSEELLPWQGKGSGDVGGVGAAQGSMRSGERQPRRGKVSEEVLTAGQGAESGDAKVSVRCAGQKRGVSQGEAAGTSGEEAEGVGQRGPAGASSPAEVEVSFLAESEKGQHEQLRDGGEGKNGAGPAGAEGGHAEVGAGVISSAEGEVGLDAWRGLPPVAEDLISRPREFVIIKSLIPYQFKYTRKNQVVFVFLEKDSRSTRTYSRRKVFTVIVMSPLLRACRNRGPPSGAWFYDNGASLGIVLFGLRAVQEFAEEGAGMSGAGQRFIREISGKRAVRGMPLQSAPTAGLAPLFGELRERPGRGVGRASTGQSRRVRITLVLPFLEREGKKIREAAQVGKAAAFLMGVCGWAAADIWDSAKFGRPKAAGRVRAALSGGYS
jgi:hypothetical protein